MSREHPKQAVICLKQAIAYNPGYEFAQYQLGIALKRLGEYEEAVKAFDNARSIAKAHDERGAIFAGQYQEYQTALL
jgi:tetratricopeptide (TPR) repeat protein